MDTLQAQRTERNEDRFAHNRERVTRKVTTECLRAHTRCRKDDILSRAEEQLLRIALEVVTNLGLEDGLGRKECNRRIRNAVSERLDRRTVEAEVKLAGRECRKQYLRAQSRDIERKMFTRGLRDIASSSALDLTDLALF